MVFVYEDKLNRKTKSVQSKNSKWKAEVVDLCFWERPCLKDRTGLARTAPWSFTYVRWTNHLFRQAKRQRSWLCIICLFISFVFHIQPDQAIIGEMLATAALFVKLDSAKNYFPVSVQCDLSFIWKKKKEMQNYLCFSE